MRVAAKPPIIPPKETSAKLFLAGSILGPVVDSLHNQCLLTYEFAPITLSFPTRSVVAPVVVTPLSTVETVDSSTAFFCSSWAVPPLLGIAYIVLGFILPRIIESIIEARLEPNKSCLNNDAADKSKAESAELRNRAILAVSSTALVIKLSEFLETHSSIGLNDFSFTLDANANIAILLIADLFQWVMLDRTPAALLAATVTAIGGPLSELPFVAYNFWHYLPESADYFPLRGGLFEYDGIINSLAMNLLGPEYKDLALSSITGPCYFAVTMDAIALGRYFYFPFSRQFDED